jgi:hypothetical protein
LHARPRSSQGGTDLPDHPRRAVEHVLGGEAEEAVGLGALKDPVETGDVAPVGLPGAVVGVSLDLDRQPGAEEEIQDDTTAGWSQEAGL